MHLAAGDEFEGLLIHQYAQRGFAVAVTDYEGLGTPGDHTYVAGRAEGNAVLDIVRAAQRLPGSGLSPNAPAAIVGYSQGGHGAGWAAQLAPGYAPELNLKAFSVGAPPANLRTVADHNDGGPNVGFGDGRRVRPRRRLFGPEPGPVPQRRRPRRVRRHPRRLRRRVRKIRRAPAFRLHHDRRAQPSRVDSSG